MRSSPVGFSPAAPAIEAPVGSEFSSRPPASKMLARWGWRPLLRRTSSPFSQPGEPQRGRPGDAPLALLVLARLEGHRALERPEVLRGDRHGDVHRAVRAQRADRPDRDLLDARGAVGAPVVGEERDARVRGLAGTVEQRIHLLVVARRPRRHEALHRGRAARPRRAGREPARRRPRRARPGSPESRTARSATARGGAACGRAWAGRGTAIRPGARTRAIRTGNGVDVGGPRVLVLAGGADRLPP